jgi:hypothetical protein
MYFMIIPFLAIFWQPLAMCLPAHCVAQRKICAEIGRICATGLKSVVAGLTILSNTKTPVMMLAKIRVFMMKSSLLASKLKFSSDRFQAKRRPVNVVLQTMINRGLTKH